MVSSSLITKSRESVFSREEAVARIAYFCSDVVYTVQSNFTDTGAFSPTLTFMASKGTKNTVEDRVTEIISLRANADPFLSTLESVSDGRIVTVTTSSRSLVFAIPHLMKLANTPMVIHAVLGPQPQPDYSEITAVRQSGFNILISTSLQEAQDLALASHSLAIRTGRGVIHFFESSGSDDPIPLEDTRAIRSLISPTDVENLRELKRRYHIYSDSTPVQRQLDSAASSFSPNMDEVIDVVNGDSRRSVANGEPSMNGTNGIDHGNGVNGQRRDNSGPDNSPDSEVPSSHSDSDLGAEVVFTALHQSTTRLYRSFEYFGPRDAVYGLVIFGSNSRDFALAAKSFPNIGIILARQYRPWSASSLLQVLPTTLRRIGVLEQLPTKTTRWTPVYIDVLTTISKIRWQRAQQPTVVSLQLGLVPAGSIPQAIQTIVSALSSENPIQNEVIGDIMPVVAPSISQQPHLETPYFKILQQLFGDKLKIINSIQPTGTAIAGELSSSPEFGFGLFLARNQRRGELLSAMSSAIKQGQWRDSELHNAVSNFLASMSAPIARDGATVENLLHLLREDGSPLASELVTDSTLFSGESPWIIGSDAWAYDFGSSGVHHVITSGVNVNMLVIDSVPYSTRLERETAIRKKDIGLYAMNFGNVYVASVAVYSSYTQVMQALIEAEKFPGPSVVLAYLPYTSEVDSPIQVLQETKQAVDSGYWPLYRWDPSAEEKGEEVFHLDSERVKKELKDFLERENHLTHLVEKAAVVTPIVGQSYAIERRNLRKHRAREAIEKLVEGLSGPPATILYASDGGNAESIAKRIGRRGKARGLKTKVMSMDDFLVEDLPNEANVIFCTSVAGQGEFPQNGRELWESLKNSTDINLSRVRYAVFALGDSHYWPRKEDKAYYNKPGKDIDRRLEALGGQRLLEIGLGDDQDPDGYETGYGLWEPMLWNALGVDRVEADIDEPKALTNEDIKISSNFLRGTILEGLADKSTGSIAETDSQLTKFHGTYQQDDRDLRDERKAQGLEPAFSFMVRVRMSGGVCKPEQWLAMSTIAETYGNQTFKLTTRQTFQFHGILKQTLRTAIKSINIALLTTLGACGDVNRNVMVSSIPTQSKLHTEVYNAAKSISNNLLPHTLAYHEIWLEDPNGAKTKVAGDAIQDYEPLYGPTYLPRKFKISIAVPPVNDVDVYAHDIGLIAIRDDATGGLAGFNVLVGGGMGMTHGSKKTYARLGQLLGFCRTTQVIEVTEAVMIVQRDNGDRSNRKHARLKYTIDDMGLSEFKRKVEERLGWKIPESVSHEPFTKNTDDFSGWVKGDDGLYSHTIFIENGRVENRPDLEAKKGLEEIARLFVDKSEGHFRLTANQHIILTGISENILATVKKLLAKYKLDNINFSGLRLSSSACVAFPTCGLAMAESERYLPTLITKLEDTIIEAGLRQASIVMRMTGCPNGCARPWVAELACVGKAPGTYNLMLGGGFHGERLNKLYRSSVKEDEILDILRPMIKQYALEKRDGEHFGDWVIRAGYITAVERGGQHGAMHEGVPEEDDV